ncbi:FKBP-type peptidyl-prolyl cis-trans isomerase [Marinobacterium arenosum]|uniref:FKBP-type peptidyl-prolyl cis-trans isomerase n=1 Tax=Marinobacterium arenosum TaxID=2862496 RepID=UPI001C94EC9B|nr:FKBP-type peptidyl-prolyl cis-trans isomerase [Marinobacterium arenosum]MBY4678668.1 FKBP-type peptidyl-prolyl cis-trans isomerase [Marinobacterium arenosum]
MWKRIAVLGLLAGLLIGCGDDAEEARFRQQLKERALNDEISRAGAQFLAENARRADVVVRDSGLQYRVLSSGNGESPGLLDTVLVHYEGMRIDGETFDSSFARGEPVRFPLNRVIKGWTEALQLMRVGDEWMLYIPAELAYGARSPSDKIPPNSTLIFRVQLLGVDRAQE